MFYLGSQDRAGLVNSLTVHGIFADEAKFLNKKRFYEDAMPTMRAPYSDFPDSPHNHCLVLTTSMPSLPEGQWLLDYEKQHNHQRCEEVYKTAVTIEKLKAAAIHSTNENSQRTYLSQIKTLEKELLQLRKGEDNRGLTMYDEASSLSNYQILGKEFFIEQRENLSEAEFFTEILNIRPTPPDAFYAKLTEKHFVSLIKCENAQYEDCRALAYDADAPLYTGMDFGANINSIITAQRNDERKALLVLKEHFCKTPLLQDDVIRDWCGWWQAHRCRQVYFHYDNSGNNRTGFTSLTRAEQAKMLMERQGWQVKLCTQGGANRLHSVKHLIINNVLEEKSSATYRIRINDPFCPCLRESMTYAKSKTTRHNTIAKDKSSERSTHIHAEHATHLSDCFDILFCGEFHDAMRKHQINSNLLDAILKR